MASTKREPPTAHAEPEAKRAKAETTESSSEPKTNKRVVLNPADCDLDFNIEGNNLQGSALYEQGFAYCWSGARASVGITGGKYCFGCKIIPAQPVDMEDTPPDQQHVCRLGISRGDDAVGNLGETEHSFGFGGTGKFSSAGKFLDYGEKFGVGDTIVCAINLENKPLASIGFSKNGKWLGTAKEFDAGPKGLGVVDSPMKARQWESALFPHVLLKNTVVEVQFSIEEGLVPQEGYKPWSSALEDGNAIMGPAFSDAKDCEVIMMVGLPASGKTTWAEKWVKEHPEKRYILLGTNLALDQMKVPGLLRKHNYGERFERLMDRATGIFNTLISRAAKTRRNYILDQTNVYKNARKRKLRPFANFRKIAAVGFPKPEQLKCRAEKRFKEMGKEVPAEAVNEMIANYVLPGSDELFDQVMFLELNREDAQRHLDEMKRDLASMSTLNSRSSSSPYSRDSSIHSYTNSSLLNRGPLPASGGQRQGSHSPLPPFNYDFQRPNLVTSTYPGGGLHGRMEPFSGAYQGNQNPPIRRDAPFVNNLSYGINNVPYHSYVADDSYGRPNIENRNSIPGGVIDPYSRSRVEPYGSYNLETAYSYRSSAERVPLTYNTHGVGIPQPHLQPPRGSIFSPSPSPSTYGSPYATLPPRSHGNLPSSTHHSGGYPPFHPGY